MPAKTSWLGADTLPHLWIYICIFFNLVGIGALLMLMVAELVIIVQNYTAYVDMYGYRYSADGYGGSAGEGFVDYTNAPKLSIIFIATLAVASDLAWRTASYNVWGGRYVTAFYAVGIMQGSHNKGFFYYVIANAFLKLFLVVMYMSQSFYGLNGAWAGSSRSTSGGSTSSGSSGGPWGSSSSSGSRSDSLDTWKRAALDDHSHGAEMWAFVTGMILLGSIIPSVIAFMFLVPWAAKTKEEGKPTDAEKNKPKSEKKGEKKEEKKGEKQ